MSKFNEEITLKITKNLNQFSILSNEEIENFLALCNYKKLQKGDFFSKEDTTCNEIGFVLSGIFRSYYFSSEEEEITYCFIFPDNFITAYSSFITQNKTQENIQAITNIEMLVISREAVTKLEQSSTNWLRFLKFVAEQEYIKLEKRVFMLQKEKAETRYKDLIENKPQFLQQIPLHYLASYLGVTQRHLSRIRKEIS